MKTIKVQIRIDPELYEILKSKGNMSEYIRGLIEGEGDSWRREPESKVPSVNGSIAASKTEGAGSNPTEPAKEFVGPYMNKLERDIYLSEHPDAEIGLDKFGYRRME